MWIFGTAAFALLFFSDINDAFAKRKQLAFLYPAGFAALVFAIAYDCIRGVQPAPWARIVFGLAAAVCLGLVVYALFFALPRQASYARPGEQRPVCRKGLYAACRHPGVLFFIPLMIFLWLGTGLGPGTAALYTALNIALSLFEDYKVFPLRLEDYCTYRQETPFIIPTPRSIRAAASGRR